MSLVLDDVFHALLMYNNEFYIKFGRVTNFNFINKYT